VKIHEYQAKEVLRRFGIPTPDNTAVETPEAAVAAARELGTAVVVVKAQVHAGGRGKGYLADDEAEAKRLKEIADAADPPDWAKPKRGGVKVVKDPGQVRDVAAGMLGKRLVTIQTGSDGVPVKKLLVEAGLDIRRELYLSMTLDRQRAAPIIMASTEGGMDIEHVAATTPEKIFKVWLDPHLGLLDFQARGLARDLGLEGDLAKQGRKLLLNMARAYHEMDASLIEMNPLVVTGDDRLIALDAKMTFDDNALFRHADVEEMRDRDAEEPQELEAKEFGLSFVALDGDIGCMVNGAGLAMATMDIIKFYGSEPANFLDVGGGAKADQIAAAFRIILKDERVRAILVNIFGGIMKCDTVAEGIIEGVKRCGGLPVPLVVRLEGTNVAEGKRMLAESGLPIIAADGMDDAARKAIAAAKGEEA